MRWEDLDTSPGGWSAQGTLECSSPAGASHVICCPGTLRTLPLMPLLCQQAPLPSDFQVGSVNKCYEERMKVENSTSGKSVCQASALQSHCVLCRKASAPVLWSAPQGYCSQVPLTALSPTLSGPDVTNVRTLPSSPRSFHIPCP